MSENGTIRAIAFDAYGTLFDVYSIGAAAEALFPGRGAALTDLWRERQLDYSRLRALCNQYADFWSVTGDALDFACDRLGLALSPTERAVLMGQYATLKAFPENLTALQRLRAAGLPLAILSNGTSEMIGSAVAAAGMTGLFDFILSVETVRTFKTAPEAYQLGPTAFGCPAAEILFVSSNGWDVCGATWFGYTTFWVNRAANPPERLGISPTAAGQSLDDVAQYVLAG